MANEPASVQATAGWTALRAARWGDARAAFDASLALVESGDAWEGLSWAAWWLDDAEAVFSAREHAYRLYRKDGDARSAARMATWLASDALDFHGALAVAGGWLRRARRLLDPLEPGPDHGWLAFHEGFVARLRNDTAASLDLALRTTTIGREFGVADLEMLGLALEGAALVDCAEVERGMHRLDEAVAMALGDDAAIPISSAWTCCFLVSACASVRDFARAAEWCDRIADFAARYGSRYMLGFCRAEYGTVHLWRGDWASAEQLLLASLEDFASSRPGWSNPSRVALAELRRRQGAVDEAAALLEEAGTGTAAQLCRARLALGDGKTSRALDLAARVLRDAGERRLVRAPALEIVVRAGVASDDLDVATAAAEDLAQIAALVGTPALLASAELAQGMIDAARGRHATARGRLQGATDRYEGLNAPYEAALARIELAATLTTLEEQQAALEESHAAYSMLDRLGSREAVTARRGDTPSVVTRRERDVLELLAQGLTNRQIAEQLVVSEHTVHRHVTNILRKLEVPTRTAAATYAVSSGLLDRSDSA